MPLLKDGKLVRDTWTHIAEGDALPDTGEIVVSLERWQKDREALSVRTDSVGIRLTAEQSPDVIREDLVHLALVELEFPAFTNGRAYSYARLLHRYGFSGEIRAVGNVLRDQYWNMQRCGFNALEIKNGETEADWIASISNFTAPYQVAHDPAKPVMSLREQRIAAAS